MKARITTSKEGILGMCLGGIMVKGVYLHTGMELEVNPAYVDCDGMDVYEFSGVYDGSHPPCEMKWAIRKEFVEIIED